MKGGEFVAAGEGFGDLYEDVGESVDLHRFFNPAGHTVLYKLAGLFETGDVQYDVIGAFFHHFHHRGLVKGGEDLAGLVDNEKGRRCLDKEFVYPCERIFGAVPAALPGTLARTVEQQLAQHFGGHYRGFMQSDTSSTA